MESWRELGVQPRIIAEVAETKLRQVHAFPCHKNTGKDMKIPRRLVFLLLVILSLGGIRKIRSKITIRSEVKDIWRSIRRIGLRNRAVEAGLVTASVRVDEINRAIDDLVCAKGRPARQVGRVIDVEPGAIRAGF